ncbi:MAG: hypothetical protein CFH32_01400 [Alphaproteobacteria bacterium MarineAlpha9_Bin2]|nr:MAG: hypothetical protein CFH32_01400 [Alphaproteobacteria bacterium MarineAlpha9_Bin2]
MRSLIISNHLKNTKNHVLWKRGNISGIIGLFFSYIDLIFVDHGIFRFTWRSIGAVDNLLYRCNQPFSWQLKNDKKIRNIKTVINLRGERNCSSYFLEKKACKKLGLKLVNFPISSREAPKQETINAAKELFKKIEYPAIMHCKSGADRAGIMAALYLILKKEIPVVEAKNQLSFKYLHIRYAKTGILDAFLESYIEDSKYSSIEFLDWVNTVYDRDKLKSSFKAYKLADIVNSLIAGRE